MTYFIIGSVAAKHWFPDWREPKDLDVFAKLPHLPGFEPFWDDRLYGLGIGDEERFATPSELYSIKHSHAYWELHGTWGKHMHDLLELKKRGAKLIPEWHDILYSIWEDLHGKKQVDLTMESDEFFTDAVKRVYEHDSLHWSVAYSDRPIYDECLKDGKSVQVDMKKVWAMPIERQIQMFREEIYVTALERLIIPHNYKYSPGAAYQWALRRTITSLTKGESAKFIVSNFDVFRRPDTDYVARHLSRKDYLIRLAA